MYIYCAKGIAVMLAVTLRIGSWGVIIYCMNTRPTVLCRQAKHRRQQRFCFTVDMGKDT